MIAFSRQRQKHNSMYLHGSRWQGSLKIFLVGFVMAAVFFGISQKFDHELLFLQVPPGLHHTGIGSLMPKAGFVFLLGLLSAILGGLMLLLPYWWFIEGRNAKKR